MWLVRKFAENKKTLYFTAVESSSATNLLLFSREIYLLLCGSSMGFMIQNVLGEKSPLFGRRTSQIHVKEFDYLEASYFTPDYSPTEKASIYGMTGEVSVAADPIEGYV